MRDDVRDAAARALGMKHREVVEVEPAGDGAAVITTHDDQRIHVEDFPWPEGALKSAESATDGPAKAKTRAR